MRRTSEQVIADILKACPANINGLMLKSNTSYRPILKCLKKGLIKIHEECPKKHKMNRKTKVKIYRITPKGIDFLQKEGM